MPLKPWGDNTDYCHIVCGGPEDSPRAKVEADTWCLARAIGEGDVKRVICYGRRCCNNHIILSSMPTDAARERFFRLQEKYSKTIQTTVPGGNPIWMSPSRTPAQRAKNRATMGAFNKINSLLSGDTSILDPDYSKQVVFVGDRRGAASAFNQLRSMPTEKVIAATVASGHDEVAIRYHFNLDVIARATGK